MHHVPRIFWILMMTVMIDDDEVLCEKDVGCDDGVFWGRSEQ